MADHPWFRAVYPDHWKINARGDRITRMPQLRTSPPSGLPPTTDPLGEVLHLLRLTGTLYCRAELTAPWGIDLPALEGCMMLHVVTSGRCWINMEGSEPHLLEQGNIALIPHGNGHCLQSALHVAADPLFDIPVEKISERYEIMRYGGGGENTRTLCVVVRFDHGAADRLIGALPKMLRVDAWQDDEGGWLQSTLQFISREAKSLRPGGETVITRLADVLVIQMIRSWIESAPEQGRGWIAALRDEHLGQALAAIHRDPGRSWTVPSLAAEAYMSRSAFCARFKDLVDESPMRYLTQWRMRLARTRLQDKSLAISDLAVQLGYQSEAAFCRAFRREFKSSPGSIRRADSPSGNRGL